LSAQPTEILGTKLKLPRQRALGLELGQGLGGIKLARADRGDRGAVKGNSYVLAQGNKTVYIYNGSGTVATFPLPLFVSIGVKK
jgi:hypothetical protein